MYDNDRHPPRPWALWTVIMLAIFIAPVVYILLH